MASCAEFTRWIAIALAGTLLVSGCAGQRHSHHSGSAGITAVAVAPDSKRSADQAQGAGNGRTGPMLVLFKRAIGVDPLVNQLIVDTNGRSVAEVTFGGADGARTRTFTMPPAQLRSLRDLLTRTRLEDTNFANPNHFTYWVIEHGHTWRLAQDDVPRAARPLFNDLTALADTYTNF